MMSKMMLYLSAEIWLIQEATVKKLPRKLTVKSSVLSANAAKKRKKLLWNTKMYSMHVRSFFLKKKRYTVKNSKRFLMEKLLQKKIDVKIKQKSVHEFVKFVHTFILESAIIILVKPPNTLYSFATPHKKKYLLQKDSLYELSFFAPKKREGGTFSRQNGCFCDIF